MNLNKIKRFISNHKKELIFGIASISIGVIGYNIGKNNGRDELIKNIFGLSKNQAFSTEGYAIKAEDYKLNIEKAIYEMAQIYKDTLDNEIQNNPKEFAFVIATIY